MSFVCMMTTWVCGVAPNEITTRNGRTATKPRNLRRGNMGKFYHAGFRSSVPHLKTGIILAASYLLPDGTV